MKNVMYSVAFVTAFTITNTHSMNFETGWSILNNNKAFVVAGLWALWQGCRVGKSFHSFPNKNVAKKYWNDKVIGDVFSNDNLNYYKSKKINNENDFYNSIKQGRWNMFLAGSIPLMGAGLYKYFSK